MIRFLAIALAAAMLLPAGAEARTKLAVVKHGDISLRAIAGGRAIVDHRGNCASIGADGKSQPLGSYCQGGLVSATRIVWSDVNTSPPDKGNSTGLTGHVTVAPLMGGGTSEIWRCLVGSPDRARNPAVAVDGDLVAVAGTRNCEPSATIELFDASAPPAATLPAPGPVTHLALAGSTVAYATAGGVGVIDRASGRPVYAATLPAGVVAESLAVRPDGTLAAVVLDAQRKDPGLCDGRSMWVFPAGRKLADRVCGTGIALAGNGVIVERLGSDGRVELDRVGLDGRATTLAALHIDPRLDAQGSWFDEVTFVNTLGVVSDGAAVGFVRPDGCKARANVYLQPIAEAAPPGDRVMPRCPPRIRPIAAGRGPRGGPNLEVGGTSWCDPDEEPCTTRRLHTSVSCSKACEGVAEWDAKPLDLRRAERDGYEEGTQGDFASFKIAAGKALRVRVDGQDCYRPGMRVRLTVITAPGVKRVVRGTVRCRRV